MLLRSSTQLYLLKMRNIPKILWMTNFILFRVQKKMEQQLKLMFHYNLYLKLTKKKTVIFLVKS